MYIARDELRKILTRTLRENDIHHIELLTDFGLMGGIIWGLALSIDDGDEFVGKDVLSQAIRIFSQKRKSDWSDSDWPFKSHMKDMKRPEPEDIGVLCDLVHVLMHWQGLITEDGFRKFLDLQWRSGRNIRRRLCDPEDESNFIESATITASNAALYVAMYGFSEGFLREDIFRQPTAA